jgi:hypothetical protein
MSGNFGDCPKNPTPSRCLPPSSVPDNGCPVLAENTVFTRQYQPFGDSLCHQNAIERIFVDLGKRRQGNDVSGVNAESGNPLLNHILLPPRERIADERCRPACLQDQLPKVGHASSKRRACQRVAGRNAQRLGIGECPNQSVRIGEDLPPQSRMENRFSSPGPVPPLAGRGGRLPRSHLVPLTRGAATVGTWLHARLPA